MNGPLGLLYGGLLGAPQRMAGPGMMPPPAAPTPSMPGQFPPAPQGGGIFPPAPQEQPSGGGGMFGGLFGGLQQLQRENPEVLTALGQGIYNGNISQGLADATKHMQAGKRKNETAQWLLAKGLAADPKEAELFATSPELMALIRKGDDIVSAGDGRLYNKTKNEWITAPDIDGIGNTGNTKEYEYAVRHDGYKGSFTDWQTKSQRTQDPTFEREKDLRSQYDLLPEVKDYKIVKSNFERIRQGVQLGTGAGDAAIVFGYMKMLDPTSVVREGEQATAQNAAGVPEAVRGYWNQLVGGGQISDEARQQILQAADKVYGEASANVEDVNKRYGGIAGQYNLDPGRVTSPTEKYEPLGLKVGETKTHGNGVTIKRLPD